MTINVFGGGSSGGPVFPVQRSVRLRSSNSAYFNRTLTTPTSATVWTWSAWVKRGALTGTYRLFGASTTTYLTFNSSDQLNLTLNGVSAATSTAVFRDPSAWYHIVYQQNGSAQTIYVNNVSVATGTTAASIFNTAIAHQIGAANTTNYFDGYLTEVNFIDGQALTPASFGSINSTTGVWQPVKYTGTYGTNGFYLNFQDNSAATAAAIGKDSSGNGNNWTPNGINVSAYTGTPPNNTSYDSMLDVPTLTGVDNANFATLNPLDRNTSTVTLTSGNLNWASGAPTYNQVCRSTIAVTSGKWYWEVTPLTNGAWANMGVADALGTLANASRLQPGGWVYQGTTGNKMNNNSSVAYGATYTNNDVIGVALDMDGNTLTFYKNGVSQGVAYSSGFSGKTITPLLQDAANDTTAAINFGQRPFSYTPPTGFKSLNTYNLPDSTIPNGKKQFDINLWTGNGTSQTIINSGSFAPDLVWIKDRTSGTNNPRFIDSIRGVTKEIYPSLTNAEQTDAGSVTAFNSNGFSIGNSVGVNAITNNVVGWQWKAGGTAVTNTSGSISSQVSANPSAGFSIVTYTANNTAGATVGHGLNVAPKFIITKNRDNGSTNWATYHSSIGATNVLVLNGTGGQVTTSTSWNNTAPSSTVFTVSSNPAGGGYDTNYSTQRYVAYCFSEIAGYSKFGSYTGNGSTDGPFVYTGFKPRWVMVKSTGVDGWVILDTSRDTYNLSLSQLIPNLSNAEDTTNNYFRCDILSNGFKLRTSSSPSNTNAVSYIYAAFAENPFKNALAR